MSINRPAAWATWALASFFYAYQYILRVAPNVLMSDITTKYQIDASTMGQFSGVYYLGYSLVHIPLGILLDRFGPKRILPIFMSLTVVGMAPLVFSEFWVYPIIGRALVGIGSSSAILGLFKIIRMTFAPDRFTWMLSLSVTIGLVGAIYGGGPLNNLNQKLGFENVVMFLMLLGIALSILTYFILPKHKEESEKTGVLQNIAGVLKNKSVLAICLLAGLMVGPLEGFADVWGSTFLQLVYKMDSTTAASLPSTIFLGMCFGGPLLSLIARKTRNDIAVILACSVAMMFAFVGLIGKVLSVYSLAIAFFVVGVACAYQIIAIAYASTRVPESQMGLTSALANMIIMTFGYVFHAAIGGVVGYFSHGEVDLRSLTPESLMFGVAVIPAGLAISAIGFFGMALKQRKLS